MCDPHKHNHNKDNTREKEDKKTGSNESNITDFKS